MIDKTYQPSEVEGRIYRTWEQAGAFRAGRPERAGAKPYSIVIPPPNVTGSLHMGHALNNTLQDILCRFERMRGKDVLWQPGTDHAGIATQMVVERQLMERQEKGRREMGREAFLKRVWEWKAESGGTIVNQLKRLGASCDWSRERFTMDEGLSRAVLKVFVELYRAGLIYKDKRLVNWDPKLLTAISDLEVLQVETKGHLWHLRYPIEGKTFNPDDPSTFIVVATTRPETMLGDTAVAVHPDDERYKKLVGKNVILPLVGRKIPIIADEYSDPEKGTGAVKITPAHDFNDFEVGKRHNLPQINIFSVEAKLQLKDNADFVGGAPKSADLDATLAMHGTDRFAARKAILARLEEKGLVEKIEPQSHVVPHGDRSNVVIEPFPDRPVVRQREGTGETGDRRGARGQDQIRAEELGEDLFRLDGKHPAVVHLAPALVGASDSGVVRAGRQSVRRDDRSRGAKRGRQALRQEDCAHARRGRARHLVLVGAVAVLDAGLAGQDARTRALLSDVDAGHRLRHHLLLGRAHDDDGSPLHEGESRSTTSTSTRWCATPPAPRCRSRRAMSSIRSRIIDDYGADALRFTLAAMAAQGRDIKLSTATRRGLPQFRDQAVERRALRRDERLRVRCGLRSEVGQGNAQPLDRARDGEERRPRLPRRSKPTTSMMRQLRPIASSGTSIATGISNSRSRC